MTPCRHTRLRRQRQSPLPPLPLRAARPLLAAPASSLPPPRHRRHRRSGLACRTLRTASRPSCTLRLQWLLLLIWSTILELTLQPQLRVRPLSSSSLQCLRRVRLTQRRLRMVPWPRRRRRASASASVVSRASSLSCARRGASQRTCGRRRDRAARVAVLSPAISCHLFASAQKPDLFYFHEWRSVVGRAW